MNDKLNTVELTDTNIEQIIGALKCTINELSKVDKKINRHKATELKTLLNYMESI